MLHLMGGSAQQACVALERALAFDPLNSQCRQLFEYACSCFADMWSVCFECLLCGFFVLSEMLHAEWVLHVEWDSTC